MADDFSNDENSRPASTMASGPPLSPSSSIYDMVPRARLTLGGSVRSSFRQFQSPPRRESLDSVAKSTTTPRLGNPRRHSFHISPSMSRREMSQNTQQDSCPPKPPPSPLSEAASHTFRNLPANDNKIMVVHAQDGADEFTLTKKKPLFASISTNKDARSIQSSAPPSPVTPRDHCRVSSQFGRSRSVYYRTRLRAAAAASRINKTSSDDVTLKAPDPPAMNEDATSPIPPPPPPPAVATFGTNAVSPAGGIEQDDDIPFDENFDHRRARVTFAQEQEMKRQNHDQEWEQSIRQKISDVSNNRKVACEKIALLMTEVDALLVDTPKTNEHKSKFHEVKHKHSNSGQQEIKQFDSAYVSNMSGNHSVNDLGCSIPTETEAHVGKHTEPAAQTTLAYNKSVVPVTREQPSNYPSGIVMGGSMTEKSPLADFQLNNARPEGQRRLAPPFPGSHQDPRAHDRTRAWSPHSPRQAYNAVSYRSPNERSPSTRSVQLHSATPAGAPPSPGSQQDPPAYGRSRAWSPHNPHPAYTAVSYRSPNEQYPTSQFHSATPVGLPMNYLPAKEYPDHRPRQMRVSSGSSMQGAYPSLSQHVLPPPSPDVNRRYSTGSTQGTEHTRGKPCVPSSTPTSTASSTTMFYRNMLRTNVSPSFIMEQQNAHSRVNVHRGKYPSHFPVGVEAPRVSQQHYLESPPHEVRNNEYGTTQRTMNNMESHHAKRFVTGSPLHLPNVPDAASYTRNSCERPPQQSHQHSNAPEASAGTRNSHERTRQHSQQPADTRKSNARAEQRPATTYTQIANHKHSHSSSIDNDSFKDGDDVLDRALESLTNTIPSYGTAKKVKFQNVKNSVYDDDVTGVTTIHSGYGETGSDDNDSSYDDEDDETMTSGYAQTTFRHNVLNMFGNLHIAKLTNCTLTTQGVVDSCTTSVDHAYHDDSTAAENQDKTWCDEDIPTSAQVMDYCAEKASNLTSEARGINYFGYYRGSGSKEFDC